VEPTVLLLGLSALGLFAGTLFVASIGGRALRRAITHARFALRAERKLSELREGPCRLAGHAFPSGPTLTAPLSGRPSVWFELRIARDKRLLATEKSAAPALLRDPSGEIPIEPSAANLEIGPCKTWRGTLSSELPPGLDEAMRLRLVNAAASVEATTGLPRDGITLDLEERAVYSGQLVHAAGTLIGSGAGASFLSSERVTLSDRPFSDVARRDALFALICIGIAFAVVGVLVRVGAAIIARI
jgi:hypothetical protein